MESVHSWDFFLQSQYSKIKLMLYVLYLVSDKGVMFSIAIGYIKYECKTHTPNLNWSGCNWNISCLFAVLTSQKGEGSFYSPF
jgi:hypothetical protein